MEASAVFRCGFHVVGPGWSSGGGDSDKSIFGQVGLGALGCEALCSYAKFILRR